MNLRNYLTALAVAIFTLAGSLAAEAAEGPKDVKVSGKIVDEAGVPIIGIAVISSDGSNGTITNDAGLFSITVPSDDVLTVTGIGYQDEKIALEGRTELLVRMKTGCSRRIRYAEEGECDRCHCVYSPGNLGYKSDSQSFQCLGRTDCRCDRSAALR